MAYYLTIKKNNTFKLLDVSSLNEFKRISKFKKNAYSLEEIDRFTSCFENEFQLKNSLYQNNIISKEEIPYEISIRLKYKNNLEKVKYGLVYQDKYKYLNVNNNMLRATILSLQTDYDFLKRLVAYYHNSYCNSITIADINEYILTEGNSDINLYNSLNNFYEKEVFYDNGHIVNVKYKSLHDLTMFVLNYIENKELKETEVKKKTKVKKLEPCEYVEQLSMLDLVD